MGGSGEVPAEDFTFFAGASTWAPGQLDEEIKKGYWILVEVRAQAVRYRVSEDTYLCVQWPEELGV